MYSKISDRKSNLLNLPIESKETIIMDNFLVTGRNVTKARHLAYIPAIILLCMFQLIIPLNAISAENEQCKQSAICSSIERGIKPVDRDSVRRANRERALKAISTPAHQVVLWGSETPSDYNGSPYTYEQAVEALNEKIIKAVNNWLSVSKEPLTKDEFETTQAFELRQKEYDKQYNKKVKARESQLEQESLAIYIEGFNAVLGAPVVDKVEYDADQETFNLSISANQADYIINVKIKTPLADAKEMKAKIESMQPWVAFQIDGEKVIPKSIILQNKAGTASLIKRLDFTDKQENQAVSIGYMTYAAIVSAKKKAEEKIAREEQEKAVQIARNKADSRESQVQPQNSTVSDESSTDNILQRANDLAEGNKVAEIQALRSQCKNMLKLIKKGMQENEMNPDSGGKAYGAKAWREQIMNYKRICEQVSPEMGPKVENNAEHEYPSILAAGSISVIPPFFMALFFWWINNRKRKFIAGYVEKNLVSDEHIIFEAKIDWVVCIPPCILIMLGELVIFLNIGSAEIVIFAIGGSFVNFLGIVLFFKALVASLTTELVVTSKRVIVKKGLISRITVEMNHSKVESINVKQSIFGRLHNYGTIQINGSGGGRCLIPYIDKPLQFRREVMEAIDAVQTM